MKRSPFPNRVLLASVLTIGLLLSSCDNGNENGPNGDGAAGGAATPTRLYGNVPVAFDLPAMLDPNDVGYVFTAQHIADDSSMVALHFDFFGIPWYEFAAGSTLPAAWVAKMDDVSDLCAQLGLPVYLAVSPIGGGRTQLAPNASGATSLMLDDSFGPPCEPIASRSDFADISAGYQAYVEYMIERFDPTFLAISIEVNMYAQSCPSAWPDMKALLNVVYATQKALHPELAIFNTHQIDELWEANSAAQPCFGFSTSCIDANLVPLQDLEGDLFAISTYPLIPQAANGSLPGNWITVFGGKTQKPLAVAETGFQFYPVTTEHPTDPMACEPGLYSDSAMQVAWMERLLADAEALDMPFVTWWGNHDGMPPSVSVPCRCTDNNDWCELLNALPWDARLAGRFFGTMGLREFDGAARDVLVPWTAAVAAGRP